MASGSSSIRCSEAVEPPPTDLRRRGRRGLRRDHPLRRELLRGARPLRARRAVAGQGQGDDRKAQDRSGSRKGSRFKPDQQTQEVLNDALQEAHAWLDTQYEAAYSPPFYDGTHWALPISKELAEGDADVVRRPGRVPLDARAVAYHFAFFSAKHYGTGQFYLIAIKDSKGEALEGAQRLSTDRACERAGQPVLVGDDLRPRHPHADPRPARGQAALHTRRACR